MRSFNTEPTDTDTDGHTLNSFSEGVFAVFGLSGYRAVGAEAYPVLNGCCWRYCCTWRRLLRASSSHRGNELANESPCVSVFIVIVVW